jgi:hypothetical protein
MNWCLSDVVSIHGPVGLRSQGDLMGEAESQTVYPEQVPAEEFMPPPEMAPVPSNLVPPQDNVPQQNGPPEERSALRFPFSFGKANSETTAAK